MYEVRIIVVNNHEIGISRCRCRGEANFAGGSLDCNKDFMSATTDGRWRTFVMWFDWKMAGLFGGLNVGSCLVHVTQMHGNGPREVLPYFSRSEVRPCCEVASINGITGGDHWGEMCGMVESNAVCQQTCRGW
jgi:hypothetical protein